jgi:hypothetical protein
LLAASILDFLLGATVSPGEHDTGNRVSLEGVSLRPGSEGTLEIGIRKMEAASLRVASDSLVLEVDHLVLHGLVARVRIEDGTPRLSTLEATSAELSGVQFHGPLVLAQGATGAAAAWDLAPLAAADGTIRAKIRDAHLLFDADVTVPIHHGQIDFNDVSVEHVGPDSRMGVSRLGLYVDAPNGRSYLYQFPSTPVAGVAYERRGALLGPWAVTSRGELQLQSFMEGLLGQASSAPGPGFTEQSKLLLDRTSLSGDLQLGDGRFAGAGLQGEFAGRAQERNKVRLHSETVARGLTADVASLSVRHAALGVGDAQVDCEELAGSLTLRLEVEGPQARFGIDLASMKLSGLRLRLAPDDLSKA